MGGVDLGDRHVKLLFVDEQRREATGASRESVNVAPAHTHDLTI
jgi:hypothetical protein